MLPTGPDAVECSFWSGREVYGPYGPERDETAMYLELCARAEMLYSEWKAARLEHQKVYWRLRMDEFM